MCVCCTHTCVYVSMRVRAFQATVSVMGSDAPGIVKEVTAAIAHPGLDILSADSEVHPAPFSGEMMFGLQLVVAVPSGLSIEEAEVCATHNAHEFALSFPHVIARI